MADYISHTAQERAEMLAAIGVSDEKELYASVPQSMLLDRLNLPSGLTELEVRRAAEKLACGNRVFGTIFRGALAYNHYIPAVVKSVVSKEEFVTAYTPYQAEISQGLLRSIFEYQTMMCSLTGLDVSNASVYDGATAAAEAVASSRERKRTKALVSAATDKRIIDVIRTYCFGSGTQLVIVPEKNYMTDADRLKELLDDSVACFYMQQPNFYGCIEDAEALGNIAKAAGAKFIMGVNPIYCAAYKTPAECGADFAVGEGQPLGMPLSFGGPYLGFMTAKADCARKLPGRIVGETADDNGNKAYVLTLQAREQHIRREKASSNICSNEALCALTAAVYMAAMGPAGMRETALQCHSKACYLAAKLEKVGFTRVNGNEFFHEFLTDVPSGTDAVSVEKLLADRGILGGLPVGDKLLWCATELNTKEEIDNLTSILGEAHK